MHKFNKNNTKTSAPSRAAMLRQRGSCSGEEGRYIGIVVSLASWPGQNVCNSTKNLDHRDPSLYGQHAGGIRCMA